MCTLVGAAASREQLTELVQWANKQGSIVVFDAAYAPFIRSPDVPKSIFEIEGSRCSTPRDVREWTHPKSHASIFRRFHTQLTSVIPFFGLCT